MKPYSFSLIPCLILALCSITASAHEFWVQPSQLSVQSNSLLRLSLMHGERFEGHPVPRDNAMISRFEFIDASKNAADVMGMDRACESFLRPLTSGVVVYESEWYKSTLDADRFNAYLEEEGLTEIIDRREQLGEENMTGREVYKRCAKALIAVAGEHTEHVDQWIGLPLEIKVDSISTDPDSTAAPTITASIRLHGKPIAGLEIVAVTKQDPTNLIILATDEDGRIHFQAHGAGNTWMLTALAIERAEEIENADWASYWASNVFAVN